MVWLIEMISELFIWVLIYDTLQWTPEDPSLGKVAIRYEISLTTNFTCGYCVDGNAYFIQD